MKSLLVQPWRSPALALLALIVGSGCAKNAATHTDAATVPAARTARLGDTVRLGRGESVGFDGDLSLTFDRVTEDSRCPEDVTCVWAGNAAVALTLRSSGGAAPFTLNTGVPPRDTLLGGVRVRLHDLAPVPNSRRAIEPGSYVATVSVERE